MNEVKEKAVLSSSEVQIQERTDDLMNVIKKSETFERYQEALHTLQKNGELYIRLNEFRQKTMALELDKGDNYYNDASLLYNEYNELLMDRCVSEFLTAEQGMCLMVKKIYDQLTETVQMDVSYFD